MRPKIVLVIIGVLVIGLLGLLLVIVSRLQSARVNQQAMTVTGNKLTTGQKLERRQLRKITIDDDTGCLEVTSEGIVRVYETCGETLESVSRPIDPKRIIQLFEYTSRLAFDEFSLPPTSGQYLRLIVDTTTGSYTIYIPVESGDDSISDTIDLIKGDIPQPTVTPQATLIPTPTLPGSTPLPSLTPTPTIQFGVTPTPTVAITPRPFTCGFSDDPTDIRPFNVTNVICSTEPSPAP